MKEYFQVMMKVEPKSGKVSFSVSGLYDRHCDACKELEHIQNSFIADYDRSEERNGNDELCWFSLSATDLKITGWVETREVIPPKRKYEVSVEYHTCVTQEVWASNEEEAKERFDETLIDFNNEVLNECKRHCDLKRNEHKPTDKVEPKFKDGDWVVQENIGTYKVIEVCESWYEVIDNQNNHYSIGFDKEYMLHLWTVQDAKDGDIIVTPYFIFLFKNIDKDGGVHYYCHWDLDYEEFDIACEDSLMGKIYGSSTNYSPATKEQRDLLFSKMKDAVMNGMLKRNN